MTIEALQLTNRLSLEERNHRVQVELTSADMIRTALMVDPVFSQALEEAQQRDVCAFDSVSHKEIAREFKKALDPYKVINYVQRIVLSTNQQADVFKNAKDRFEKTVNNGVGKDYIAYLQEADPEDLPVFLEARMKTALLLTQTVEAASDNTDGSSI